AELSKLRVVRQPEFKKPTEAAEVAVDAEHRFDLVSVDDRSGLVPRADGAEVGRDAHADGARQLLNGVRLGGMEGQSDAARAFAPTRTSFVACHESSPPGVPTR